MKPESMSLSLWILGNIVLGASFLEWYGSPLLSLCGMSPSSVGEDEVAEILGRINYGVY